MESKWLLNLEYLKGGIIMIPQKGNYQIDKIEDGKVYLTLLSGYQNSAQYKYAAEQVLKGESE